MTDHVKNNMENYNEDDIYKLGSNAANFSPAHLLILSWNNKIKNVLQIVVQTL